MKRSLLGLFGCLLATSVLAQGPVYSVNVVGFNKMTIERGKLYLIATAFEDIAGNTLHSGDVIGTQLPSGSEAHFYRGTPTPYLDDSRGFAGWTTNIVYRGFMGFWVKVPANAAQPSYDLVLKGQVPMANTTSNIIVQGLNMLGYPYTADMVFSNTALYANSSNGDEIHFYNPATTNYLSFSKGFAGWPVAARTNVIRQGVGFWYKHNGTSFLDTESRPYPTN